MKTNSDIKRLRWVMAGVMLSDMTLTLAGQPASYWQKPATAVEANRLFALIVTQGWMAYVFAALFCIASVTFLVSILPRRLALVVLLASTLTCYFGASSWLVYHFSFGSSGELVYGIIISIALVKLGLDTRDKAAHESR